MCGKYTGKLINKLRLKFETKNVIDEARAFKNVYDRLKLVQNISIIYFTIIKLTPM